MMKYEARLRPVSAGERGEGLPYAPENWPGPGNTWTWKVGKRTDNNGFYQDRYLIGPVSLQKKANKRLFFMSKKSIKDYLQSEFPHISVDAFFASFSWKVPAETSSINKEQFRDTRPEKVHVKAKVKRSGEKGQAQRKSIRLAALRFKAKNMSRPRFARCSSKNMSDIIEISSSTQETGTCDSTRSLTSPIDSQNNEISSSLNTSHSPHTSSFNIAACHAAPIQFQAPEDFDNLINSMDVFLSRPLPIASVLPPATDHAMSLQEQMTEAKHKLSLLIAEVNPVTLSANKVSELSFLSSLLKNDTSLTPEQRSMLMLIDEMPFACKELGEAKKVEDEADKFFADLNGNVSLATRLKNDYNEAKEKEGLLEADVKSCSLEMERIDKQIVDLQGQRAKLSTTIV